MDEAFNAVKTEVQIEKHDDGRPSPEGYTPCPEMEREVDASLTRI